MPNCLLRACCSPASPRRRADAPAGFFSSIPHHIGTNRLGHCAAERGGSRRRAQKDIALAVGKNRKRICACLLCVRAVTDSPRLVPFFARAFAELHWNAYRGSVHAHRPLRIPQQQHLFKHYRNYGNGTHKQRTPKLSVHVYSIHERTDCKTKFVFI